MAHDAKIQTISDFVRAVEAIKKDVKADTLTMLAAIPIEVLGDPIALEDFMLEMVDVVLTRHILTPERKIKATAAKAIHAYVKGMQ